MVSNKLSPVEKTVGPDEFPAPLHHISILCEISSLRVHRPIRQRVTANKCFEPLGFPHFVSLKSNLYEFVVIAICEDNHVIKHGIIKLGLSYHTHLKL